MTTDLLELAKKLATEGTPEVEENPFMETEELYTSQEILDLTTALRIQEVFDSEGRKVKNMQATPMAWVHNLIHHNGSKFDFTGREYLAPIYNATDKRILLMTARQVEKTTQLANKIVLNSIVHPYFKSLYVSPSHMQTRQFSNEKLKPVIEQSPIIAKYLVNSAVSSQVFEKGFTNGSMIFLRSAFLTADRARGISSDFVAIDELQDMLINNIPVILECLSHSKYKYQCFAGTPKTFENTIHQYWNHTTQCEWMVPCDCQGGHSGRYWNFLNEHSISRKLGVICSNCGKKLDVSKGQWAAAKPGASMVGYRIPQLMVPWIINKAEDWEVLVHKFETYPTAQFQNEVLGLSYDNANKPITRAELMACSCPTKMWASPLSAEAKAEASRKILFMGIDWGEGRDGGKTPTGKVAVASYTIVTIGGYEGQKFKVFWAKKYTGKEIDPEFVVQEVAQIATFLGIRCLGVDWGHGWGVNNALIRMLGPKKVCQFMHLGNLKERRKWDQKGMKFELNRNLLMSELFLLLKSRIIEFPLWNHIEPFAMDILAIFAEYSEYSRTIRFDHKASEPDDFFHSLLYTWQVANVFLGRKD